MKILIVLIYWERPNLVKNALKSLVQADKHYQNWELAFIDDSSNAPGKPIVEITLNSLLEKISFYHTNTTLEEKIHSGGKLGFKINQSINESDADIAVLLCDDDALCPNYLLNLHNYFQKNATATCCYSKVHIWDPLLKKFENVYNPHTCLKRINGHYTFVKDAPLPIILPSHEITLDGSQLAWRINEKKKWVLENRTVSLDISLLEHFEQIPYSGFTAQYKAVWQKNLGKQLNEYGCGIEKFWKKGMSPDIPKIF